MSHPGLFYLLGFILVFAPLIRGGNRPLALLALEIAGLLGLAALAWSRREAPARERLPATLWWGLALLVAIPLLQLVPLPAAWWSALPGREMYAQVLDLAGADVGGSRALTINARATQYSWLVLIPCLAVFFMVQRLHRRQLRRLVVIFLAVAVCEAVLGIVQVGSARGSWVNLGNPYAGGASSGTYVNKNHFAALMAMALPVVLAIWALQIVPVVDHHGEIVRDHPRNRDVKLAIRLLFSVLVAVLLLALLMTRSRAGIASGFAAFALASLGLVWKAGSRQARIALAAVAALALFLGAYVGLTPVIERFAPDEFSLQFEGRLRLALTTVRAGLDFLPFGSGLGTFADVFRHYQADHLTGFVDHAHNDYAEAFLEMGVAGMAAIALLGIAYLARWRSLVREPLSRRLGFVQFAAGLGMLAMIVHGAFDFNFHIPANAIYFSFLAGVFFFTPGADPA